MSILEPIIALYDAVPRRRGDEPRGARWSATHQCTNLFPAGAGMNRLAGKRVVPSVMLSVPRRRGDEPVGSMEAALAGLELFPAGAGMNPSLPVARS